MASSGCESVRCRKYLALDGAQVHDTSRVALEDHSVAVLEERARASVGKLEWSFASPRQLDEAALAAAFRAGDRARGVQIARPDRGAVRGEVGELLRDRPVEPRERRGGHR